MKALKKIRMTLIIIVIGVFFISGCIFQSTRTVTFKTNGGSTIKSVSLKSGSKLEEPTEPKKDGYVFEGWYLNGEEYDFEEEVDEDITLVAKWSKSDIVEDEETTTVDEETTTTTKETTTAKSTSKKSTNKKTTTKKVTTTTVAAVAEVVNQTSSTDSQASNNTSTNNSILDNNNNINNDIAPDYASKKINIEIINYEENVSEAKFILSLNDKDRNITYDTNILTDKIVYEFFSENIENYVVYSNNVNYDRVDGYTDKEIIFKNDTDDNIQYYIINNGKTSLVVRKDINDATKYILSKPNYIVNAEEISPLYYDDLQTAINKTTSGKTVSILSDVTLADSIIIDKPIIIIGNSKKISLHDKSLFIINDFDDEGEVTLSALEVDVLNVFEIKNTVDSDKLKAINIINCKGSYANKLNIGNDKIKIIQQDNSISGIPDLDSNN